MQVDSAAAAPDLAQKLLQAADCVANIYCENFIPYTYLWCITCHVFAQNKLCNMSKLRRTMPRLFLRLRSKNMFAFRIMQ